MKMKKKMRQDHIEANKKYENQIQEGEQKSIATGKQSKREEAFGLVEKHLERYLCSYLLI